METTSATCPSCDAPVSRYDQPCPNCGAAPAAANAEEPYAQFGAGIVDDHEAKPRDVKKSTRVLLALALMFAVFGTIQGMRTRSDARDALTALEMYDDAEVVEIEGQEYTVADLETQISREVWLVFGSNYLLAGVMLGLFFWARTKPYQAMIVGLCIYIGVIGLNAFYDPETLTQGVVIKVLIIAAMVAGIRAARAEYLQAAKLPRATLA